MKLTRRAMIKAGSLAAAALFPVPRVFGHFADLAGVKVSGKLKLWYRRPANSWIEALALGNGRLGAMIFGGTGTERIGLNEDTLWSGGPYTPAKQVTKAQLAEIRQAYFDGMAKQAQGLVDKYLMADPITQASYQTVGELVLNLPGHEEVVNYRRELDLETAVVTVTYQLRGVNYRREYFSSRPDQVIVVRITADKPGMIAFKADMTSPQATVTKAEKPGLLIMNGKNGDMMRKEAVSVKAALTFQSRLQARADGGTLTAGGDTLEVANADAVTLLIAMATSYKSYKDISGNPDSLCGDYLFKTRNKTYEALKQQHIAAHQRVFSTVELDLEHTGAEDLPADERIKSFDKHDDPALAALYFQFGRYLLISSSRPGSQPANLQGIWNKDMMAAWGGKYTVNINTEMNYWPAHVTNLSECEDPLFEMVKDLSVTGAITAQQIYHARGWVCHHNTDLWRATAPIDNAFYGQWQTGGAWLCNQLYQRYLFEGDTSYLKRLYPIVKGAAQFFIDTLVAEPTHGWLVTCPSNSPEHEYQKGLTISAGPTMDNQIIRELFANCIQAAGVLSVDRDFINECRDKRQKLPPNQVGKAGQLQEWLQDLDMEAPEIAHRHMSPLYGLYPGNEITPANPADFAAARKLTDLRGLKAAGMGWSVAWRINLWARLQDAGMAYHFLEGIIINNTEVNFFDKPAVQLDGNYGATAGIAEMLVQSHAGAVQLLPALPEKWPSGSVKGLRARGGFVINELTWASGKITRLVITSTLGGNCRLRVPNALKGQNFNIAAASGVNTNHFFAAVNISKPLIKEGVTVNPVTLPETITYDIETAINKTYTLVHA